MNGKDARREKMRNTRKKIKAKKEVSRGKKCMRVRDKEEDES